MQGLPIEARQPNARPRSRRSTVPGCGPFNDEQHDGSVSLRQSDRQAFAKMVADLVIERMESVIKDAVGACKASACCPVNSGLVIEMDKLLEESPMVEKNKGPNTTKHKKRTTQTETRATDASPLPSLGPKEQALLDAVPTSPLGPKEQALLDAVPTSPLGPKELPQASALPQDGNSDCNAAAQEQLELPRGFNAQARAQIDSPDMKPLGKEISPASATEPSDGQSKSQGPEFAARSPSRKASTSPSKVSEETDQRRPLSPGRFHSGNTDVSEESPSSKERTWSWARSPKRSKTRESDQPGDSLCGDASASDGAAEAPGGEENSPGTKSRASFSSSPGGIAGGEDEMAMQATPSTAARAQRNTKKAQTVKNIAGEMANALFEAEELTFASCRSCPIGPMDSPKSPKKKGGPSWWLDRSSASKKVLPEVVGLSASSGQHPAELCDVHGKQAPPVDFASFNIDMNPAEKESDEDVVSEEMKEMEFGIQPTYDAKFEAKSSARYAVSDSGDQPEEAETQNPAYFSMFSSSSRPVQQMMSFSAMSAPAAPGSLVSRRISCSVESLRQQRDEHLMELYHITTDSAHSEEQKNLFGQGEGEMSLWSVVLLRICGIIPWCVESHSEDAESFLTIFRRPAAWYKLLVLLVASISLAICLEQVVTAQAATSESGDDSESQLGLLSDVPIAVGSILGLLSTGSLLNRKGFQATYNLLVSYGQREELLEQWASSSRCDLVATLVVWVCAVFERIRGGGILSSPDRRHVLDLMVFIFTSLLLMGLAFCLLHVCRLLTSMVDAYCVHFVSNPKLNEAVRHWNIIQAMLREACAAIEYCFIVLQTTALAAVLLSMADTMINTNRGAMTGAHLLTLLPGALITLGVARIFYCAAEVTEKCARVPTLINGLFFGKDIDTERQYVVEYIINSAAGFYVFEVRLTSAMALKFAYLSGVAAFFVATKVLLEGGSW